jgi:hypothetical protein
LGVDYEELAGEPSKFEGPEAELPELEPIGSTSSGRHVRRVQGCRAVTTQYRPVAHV